MAVKRIGQIEKAFGKKLPVAALFQAPTVEQFSQLICQDDPPTRWSSLVPLQPNGSKDPFFWIHGEASDGFLARYLGSDQPVYGLRHQGEDGKPLRYTTVETIAAHYASVPPRSDLEDLIYLEVIASARWWLLKSLISLVNKRWKKYACFSCWTRTNPRMFSWLRQVRQWLLNQPRNRHLSSGGLGICAASAALARPAEKLDYCLTRLNGVVKRDCVPVATPVVKIAKKITIEACLKLGYKIPVAFRSSYILTIYGRAVQQYIPSTYPGRLDIFMSAEGGQDSQCWSQLAEGGVEIHVVPGDHRSVLKEPYLKHWAGKLENSPERTMVHRTRPILLVRGRRLPVSTLHVNNHR